MSFMGDYCHKVHCDMCNSYSTVPGIYGSKQTEPEGVARGRGLFTTGINPWPPSICAITAIYPTSLVLCCYYCKYICTCANVYSNFNIIYCM